MKPKVRRVDFGDCEPRQFFVGERDPHGMIRSGRCPRLFAAPMPRQSSVPFSHSPLVTTQ
jgi:hypothetical protein